MSELMMDQDALARFLRGMPLYGGGPNAGAASPAAAPEPIRNPAYGRPVKLTDSSAPQPEDAPWAQPVDAANVNRVPGDPGRIATPQPVDYPKSVAIPTGPAPDVRPSVRSVLPPPAVPETKFTPAPKSDQYKPRWYERLGGALTAAAIAYGNPHSDAGYQIGSSVTNRRFNGAMNDWERQNAVEKEQAANQNTQYKNLQSLYQNTLNQDYRERGLDQKEEAQAEGRRHNQAEEVLRGQLNQVRDENNQLKDPDAIFARRGREADKLGLKGDQKTFYMANGKLRETDPNSDARTEIMRQQLELQKEREDALLNGMSPSQKRQFDAETRRYNTRINALESNRAMYLGSDDEASKKALAAIDAELNGLYDKVDAAYERSVGSRAPARPSAPGTTPSAPVTRNTPPSQRQPQSTKQATQAEVRQFAKAKGMTYQQMYDALAKAGYQIKK